MKLSSYYKFSLALSALCILGATTQPADADTPSYTVIDLGTLTNIPTKGNYLQTEASGINNAGQVVGSAIAGNSSYGFRTAPNSPINQATDNLGDLGGNIPGPFTFATGINKSGQVVGLSTRPLPGAVPPSARGAFRTAPNSPINPDTDSLGGITTATAINQAGQVVGFSFIYSNGPPNYHAFRTAPNSSFNPDTDELGTLGGTSGYGGMSSYATAINKSGRVVGYSTTDSGETHAFRTARNQPINPATDDLGTLGGTSSHATGINRLGQVVGNSTTSNGETHAFRTARNRAINPATDDLGTLGGTFSEAVGINKLGQVVGNSTTANGERHVFLYDVNGELVDLNSLISPDSPSNFSSLTATAINDRGQIVGYGFIPNGCQPSCNSHPSPDVHAFLATPVNY